MTQTKHSKEQIDQVRNSAGSMRIGTEEDGAVLGMLEIDGRLHILKDKAIYRIMLADETDPERTRIDIPNTQQRIMSIGADAPVVQRVLLTAKELFDKDRLSPSLNAGSALSVAMELTRNINSADEIAQEIRELVRSNQQNALHSESGALSLPFTPNLVPQCKTFVQKAEHALQCMSRLCILFCGEAAMKPWPDGLVKYMVESGADAEIIRYSEEFADFGKKMRNIRHCIEHEKKNQRLIITDYRLDASRTIVSPTIEIVHEATPMKEAPVEMFMHRVVETLINFAESLIAIMASRNVADHGAFNVCVGDIPEKERRFGVRYGYLIEIGGVYQRLG